MIEQRPTAPATVLYSGRRIPLARGELSIGRLPANDLVIDKEAVSRHHAQILAGEGGYQIIDLGSRNGTQLNGERFRADSRWLVNGDTIVVGGEALRFLTGQETRLLSAQQPLVGTQIVRFAGSRLAIGRDASNDVVLDHPAVSRFHAEVVRDAEQVRLRDLGSRNGTRLDGEPIARDVELQTGSEIGIGPFRLLFDGDAFVARSDQGALRLDAEAVGMEVKGKEILAPTSLSIAPGEFVAIIGESGAGKTTLLKALAGVTAPTRGAVLVNGEPIRSRLSDIGYLPQDEIVHPNLTVRESLRYSAKLRLPAGDIDATVERVASELGLGAHMETRIGSLSGGQRKRAGVATELLSRPSLLFLDEPTTGLDPGLESKLMALLRELSAAGVRAVVLVTHATKNLGMCDRLVVMGRGGILCFEGRPADALRFFGVDSYDAIYEALEEGRPDEWQRKFLAQTPAPGDARDAQPATASRKSQRRRGRLLPQTGVLVDRYALLVARDRRNLLILLGQVPVLALVIVGLFGQGLFDRVHGSARDATTVLFLIVTTALWLGAIAAAREVVKEKGVFVRESAVGVRVGAYVLSKAIVLFAIAALQTVALTAIIVAFRPFDEPSRTYVAVFAILIATSFAAVGTGLLVSALVRTQDQATSFIPLVLIPQLFLGGILVTVAKMNAFMAALSTVVVARWAFAGAGSALHANARIAADRNFARVSDFGPSFFGLSQTTTFLVLGGFVVAAFAAVTALLATASRRA